MLKKGLMRKAALMITVSAMMVTGCGKKENTDSTVIPSTENTESTQESTSAAQAGDNNSQEETSLTMDILHSKPIPA